MTPACGCHGEEMRWNRDPRYKAGGYWRCRASGNAQRRARYAAEHAYRMQSQMRARQSERKRQGLARPDVRPEIAAALRTVKRPRS